MLKSQAQYKGPLRGGHGCMEKSKSQGCRRQIFLHYFSWEQGGNGTPLKKDSESSFSPFLFKGNSFSEMNFFGTCY